MTHPITPSSKLVEQWYKEWLNCRYIGLEGYIATQAARWGADQELEACVEWVCLETAAFAADLQAARRPKPTSLKQQALDALQRAEEGWRPIPDDCDTIRRALQTLPDD